MALAGGATREAAQRAALDVFCAPVFRAALTGLTLEKLVTSPSLAAFRPSAAQRALIRAADGIPIGGLIPDDRMRFHFGVTEAETSDLGAWPRPRIVVLRTGVRAGKSLLAAMGLLQSILMCTFRRAPDVGEDPDADGLIGVRPGELVRALIVAPLLKLSRAPFDHIIGTMRASPTLSRMLVTANRESAVIRRPDGRDVHLELVAASSGGTNLRSTWLAGVIYDEADFHDGEDGAVNLPDNLRAGITRILPGAQAWIPSSPWADEGPFHEIFTGSFGQPGTTLSFHSDSRSMNPTLDRELEADERRRDPDNAAREYDAIPLSAGSSLFFPRDAVDACIDLDLGADTPLDYLPGIWHFGGTDLGFRKNSSALGIARRNPASGKVEIAYYEEKRPPRGAALKPSEVCADFARELGRYQVKSVRGDMHYSESAREHFGGANVAYEAWNPSQEAQTDAFTMLRSLITEGQIRLPNDARLLTMIRRTKSRAIPGGRVQIVLPKMAAAHGDTFMAIVLACMQVPKTTSQKPRSAVRRRASPVRDQGGF